MAANEELVPVPFDLGDDDDDDEHSSEEEGEEGVRVDVPLPILIAEALPASSSSSVPPVLLPAPPSTLPPLFSTAPIEYMKVKSAEGHIFYVDKDAARRFSRTINDLLSIDEEMARVSEPFHIGSSSSSFSSSSSSSSSSSFLSSEVIHFREVGTDSLDLVFSHAYWKKRWWNNRTQRTPEFHSPPDNLLAGLELLCDTSALDA